MSRPYRKDRWLYRRDSENPFHSWWYNVVAYPLNPILALFGFCIMLRRCEWTRSSARLTIAFVGW